MKKIRKRMVVKNKINKIFLIKDKKKKLKRRICDLKIKKIISSTKQNFKNRSVKNVKL